MADQAYYNLKTEYVVAFICGLHYKTKYFHLKKCLCGGWVWEQPCPCCGYYPYGDDPEARRRAEAHKVTKEQWVQKVLNSGTILDFYLDCYKKCVDPQDFITDAIREYVKASHIRLPHPSLIWDLLEGGWKMTTVMDLRAFDLESIEVNSPSDIPSPNWGKWAK